MAKTLTPSFRAFRALAGSLRAAIPNTPDMALELQHLLGRAPQQTEGAFLVQIQDFLRRLQAPLQRMSYQDAPAIFQHVENFLSTFGDFIQAVEPGLAADIKAALAKGNHKKKKAALLQCLADQRFAAALAVNLKAFVTPTHLSKQEHIDSVQDWAFESLDTDNQHVAAQGAYGENAWVRQLLRLLFSMAKMVSAPPLCTSGGMDKHQEKERRIPMKMP